MQEHTTLGTKAAVLQVKVIRRIISSYDIIGTLSMGINFVIYL